MIQTFALNCPMPIAQHSQVLLAHGGGGRLMHDLIEKVFMAAFQNPLLAARHDGAIVEVNGARLAFSTDSYVVRPLFFPGGDIGRLAVHGTVNDLAMCGAQPMCLSAAMILEEGLPMETVWRVAQSMQQAAAQAGVHIVTGDTKVVDRGKGDGIFISTAGIGVVPPGVQISPAQVRPGDLVLLSGDVGRHGIAIMAVREGLAFDSVIESDTAPLAGLVAKMLDAGVEIHCLRDLTRGGLASAAVEIAEASGLEIRLDERAIPVREDVRGACELLGFDPLYVANEGRFIAFAPPACAERALQVLHGDALGEGAAIIGQVHAGDTGVVTVARGFGTARILDMLSGEQLPRIC